ncbi:MAG: hypothetical protein ABSE42_05735 [Bryobacteraceae bacterium]|jgi:hypothetical protein
MATQENTMSVGGRHALRDMVELQMYLAARSQQTPWPLLPRRARKTHGTKAPDSNLVEFSAVKELVDGGFIEASSSRTFVVSKSGYRFYEEEMKSRVSA